MTTEALIGADLKTTPYEHQLIELEQSLELEARALLWTMRTGKTKVIVDTACHLHTIGKIDGVLVIAPNGVHENWVVRELPVHSWPSVECRALTWRSSIASTTISKQTKKAVAARDTWWDTAKEYLKPSNELTWFAFNSEAMTREDVRKLIAKIVKKLRILIVFDESHDFRSPGSKRTKMARALAKRCQYRRILTGTPVTNSPLHAFSQFELLSPGALGFQRFEDFKLEYADYQPKVNGRGQRYMVLKEYKNLDKLAESVQQWSSVISRDDCKDLPDLVRSRILVELTQEQVRLYRDLHTSFMVNVGSEEVSVGENTMRLMKLQQVVSGFIIDEEGDLRHIPGGNPRLDAISQEGYMTPGKIIVWCQFKEDMRLVAARLRADGHKVIEYHGRTTDAEKAEARKLFAPGAVNDIKALVGHPKSGGQGLNLAAADKIIWYSHTFDAIIREQADERATEVGGKNINLVDIVAPGVDNYILDNVLKKISVAQAITNQSDTNILEQLKL